VAEALTDVFGGRGRIVLDGEVVALVQGRPSFERLQKRMNTLRPSTAVRRQVPVTYLPFDVLRLDGGNLIAAPYLERRAALTDLGHELHGAGLPLQVLPHWVGVESAVILEAAQNASMEGALLRKCRRRTSPASAPGRGGRCCCAPEALPW
jgi:bifunctional non-homologous end joining protein LigD